MLIRVAADAPDVRGLGGPAALAQARLRLLAAQDRVRASLDNPSRGVPFRRLPWVVATLTREELQRLAQHPDVLRVEPDVLMRPSLVESTSTVHAMPLWQFGYAGQGWSVAILDTGVDSAHPFLGGRVVGQACFSTTDASESASSLCPGGASQSTAVGSGEPCPGLAARCVHGTHVAGIAAGRSLNGSGVGRAAGIIAVQVYSRFDSAEICRPDPSPCALSYVSDQAHALEHIAERAGSGNANRIAAANLSLTGPDLHAGTCDEAFGMAVMKEAIDDLRALGIATTVSSGNNGSTTSLSTPACVSSAISVGSTLDSVNVVSSFSNRSPLLSLMAPGGNITSSVPGGGFATMSGTSMAAPHVAGAWALLKQLVPGASVPAILDVLRSTGVPVSDSSRTYPRILLDQAALTLFGSVPPPPGAPQDPVVTVAGASVTFQWSAPPGSAVGEYFAIAGTQAGAADVGTFSAGEATAISAVAAPGTYWVRAVARNPAGTGPPSADVSFTVLPPEPPGTPSGLSANVGGRTVTLTWQAPATGGTPVAYRIEAGSAPGLADLAVFDTGSTLATASFSGVPPGTYHVRVRARGPLGAGPPTPDIVVVVN